MPVLDVSALQATLSSNYHAIIPAGTWTVNSPIYVPPLHQFTLEGAGHDTTSLVFAGGDGILSTDRNAAYACATIKQLSLLTTANGGDAIRMTHPWPINMHDPQLIIQNVHIGPQLGYEGTASWGRGIAVDHFWGPKISNCWITGNFNGFTKANLLGGHSGCAIELGGSQEAKITDSYIACWQTGIHCNVPFQGCGEGLGIEGNAIINCICCVDVEGSPVGVFGAVCTPWLNISNNHLFYLDYAIRGNARFDCSINNNSVCASHLIATGDWGTGLYFAGDCTSLRIMGNSFWSTKLPLQGSSIVIDNCHEASIVGNVFDKSMVIGVYLANVSGPVTGVQYCGNSNRTIYPVLNYGTGNTIVL